MQLDFANKIGISQNLRWQYYQLQKKYIESVPSSIEADLITTKRAIGRKYKC